VVGFSGDRLFLMPTSTMAGIMPNARVIPHHTVAQVGVGDALLGRIIDGAGRPLDGRGPVETTRSHVRLTGVPINPLRASRSWNRSTSACARSTPC
jgi:flagellum-specific ATP synthase